MQRPRFLRPDVLARVTTRLRHSLDVPPRETSDTASTGLITQDGVEDSTLAAQSMLDGGGLKAGQTITIEGHRQMTVTVEAGRVVLIPAEGPVTSSE